MASKQETYQFTFIDAKGRIEDALNVLPLINDASVPILISSAEDLYRICREYVEQYELKKQDTE